MTTKEKLTAQIKYASFAAACPILSPSPAAAEQWIAVRDRALAALLQLEA